MNTIFARYLTTMLEPRLFLKKLSFGSTLPYWLRPLGSILISGLTLAILSCLLLTSPTPAYADEPIFSDSGQRLGNTDATDVALGDLDNDGDLDAFVVNSNITDGGQPNKVWLNDGRGHFSDSGQNLGDSDSLSVALGDLDGDGDLDAFVTNGDALNPLAGIGNTVWLNDGTATFTDSGQSLGHSASTAVALGDLDEDGDLDAFVANVGIFGSEANKVWLNDGTGHFTTDSNHSLGSSLSFAVALADLDGDGDLDAFVGNMKSCLNDGSCFGDRPNKVWVNDGAGQFTDSGQSLGDSDTLDITLKDVNGDGHLDAFVANGNRQGSTFVGQPDKVFLNDGTGHFSDSTQSLGSSASMAVALEDLDRDGDIDAFIGTHSDNNQVWLNDSLGNFPDNQVENLEESISFAVALGDLDGDGDLDAFIGNVGANEVWLNLTHHFIDSGQNLGDLLSHNVALGDLNGDGLLDALAANRGPNKVWLNDGLGGLLDNGQDWTELESDVAPLADLDGDGDLDTFVANRGPNQIWLNDGNGVFSQTNQSLGDLVSRDVALGDLDGDGDLDAFVLNGDYLSPEPNQVWLNDGNGTFSDSQQSLGNSDSRGVALGDIDGDGDLDAFVANHGGNKIWLNDGAGHFTTNDQALGSSASRRVGLGDLDSDGDLDAFVANDLTEPNKVWLNDGSGNFDDTQQSLGNLNGSGVALEDLDGDGDLDAFVANSDQHANTLWINDGDANFTNSQSLGNSDSRGVALGDIDGDGDLDAFVANNGASQVYWAKIGATTRFQVSVQKPGPTQNADFYSSPEILTEGRIPITYTLFDPQSAPIGQVKAYYSMDGGDNWQEAVPTEESVTTSLSTEPYPTKTDVNTHLFVWDTFASGFFGQSDNVVLRFVAYPQPLPTGEVGTYQYTNQAPTYLWPYAATTTFPFRVRGTQVRVYSDTIAAGNELADALVYRLPTGQSDANPLVSSANQPLTSDQNGYLTGRGLLALGDELMAMWPVTTTNSYTFYHTSATPTESGLEMASVSDLGVQELVVSADNALLVFDLDVSLEWDARNESAFVSQLESDLERTSEILYDLTNGQVALGEIRVHHAKENWNYSHIVVHASNALRPSATLGGIVREPVSETLSNTQVITDAYLPGQIHMSALWNRFGNPAGGDAVEDWPRTLAHELAHYLLFIPDNYLGLSEDGLLVKVECPGSAMTDAYREDYSEFLTRNAWDDDQDCRSTLAEHLTGRSDWETVTTFYEMLKGDGQNVGPSHLPLNVTQVRFYDPDTPVNTLLDPFFNVTYQDDPLPLPFGQAQGYLFKTQNTEVLTDDVVLPLGSPINDLLRTRGAEPGDRLCLFDYGHSPRRLGCIEQISQASQSLALHDLSEWDPQIIVNAVTSVTLSITVTQEIEPHEQLKVQILPAVYPMTTTVVRAPVALMHRVDTDTFTETVTLDYPIANGFVRVWVTEGPQREEMSEFSISGGWGPNGRPAWGPNGRPAWGPNGRPAWGPNGRPAWGATNQSHSWQAPIRGRDAQVTIFDLEHIFGGNSAYALQSLSAAPHLPSWLTQVGQAYRFSVDEQLTSTLNIMFEYMQREVPGDREDRLRIYYSPDEGQNWQLIAPELDTYRNLASARMPGGGIYTLISTIELPLSGPGWNNFAYLAATQPLTTALASIGDAYNSVAHYDDQEWHLYDRTIAPEFTWVNDLTHLEFEQAYWLYATEAITLYLGTGEINNLSRRSSGLQLPPATFYGPVSANDAFTPTVGMAISAYIDGNLCGQSTIEERNNQLVYKLQVRSENLFGEPNGCGANGKLVVFEVEDWLIEGAPEWDNSQASYHPLPQPVNPSTGTFTTELFPGWNLISIPIQPAATAIEELLTSIAGNYSIVYAYHGCDTDNPWKSYDPSAPSYANDLTDINFGMGLWINMTISDTLEVTGTEAASSTLPLCAGWNLVGYPFQQTKPITDALAPLEGNYTIVYGYQASDTSDPWEKHDPAAPSFANDLTQMQPGLGYWIRMTQDAHWPFD